MFPYTLGISSCPELLVRAYAQVYTWKCVPLGYLYYHIYYSVWYRDSFCHQMFYSLIYKCANASECGYVYLLFLKNIWPDCRNVKFSSISLVLLNPSWFELFLFLFPPDVLAILKVATNNSDVLCFPSNKFLPIKIPWGRPL